MKIPKKPLREIMLDTHSNDVKQLFEIPQHKKLHYNKESTQICVDNEPIFTYFSEKVFDSGFTSRINKIRSKRRTKIIEAHSKPSNYSAEDFFHLQFDYELLAIDHLVDVELASNMTKRLNSETGNYPAQNYFLTPASGKTFFEEVYLKELESLGHHLLKTRDHRSEKDFFFSDKNFNYFLKHTMTRDKLIRIILDYGSVESKIRKRYDSLTSTYQEFKTTTEVYDRIKDIRIEQMRRRGTRALLSSKLTDKERTYLDFVGAAFDFNEDNRLLRSISFYHVMKDKEIGGRFYELIESRKNDNR